MLFLFASANRAFEPTTFAAGSTPKLLNIDLQPYQTVQACERADIMNIGGFSDAVFARASAFLAYNNQRFVAEVEAIELQTCVVGRPTAAYLKVTPASHIFISRMFFI